MSNLTGTLLFQEHFTSETGKFNNRPEHKPTSIAFFLQQELFQSEYSTDKLL